MKTSAAQVALHRSFDELSARVREAGMLLISCDMHGVMSPPRGDGDWLSALIERPAIVRNGLTQAAAHWAHKAEPAPCPGVPGCLDPQRPLGPCKPHMIKASEKKS